MDITRREPTRISETLSPEGRDDSPETGKPKDRPGGPILGRRPPSTEITRFVDDDAPKQQHVETAEESPRQVQKAVSTGMGGDVSEKKVPAEAPRQVQKAVSTGNGDVASEKKGQAEAPRQEQKAASTGNGDVVSEKKVPAEAPRQEQKAASTGNGGVAFEKKVLAEAPRQEQKELSTGNQGDAVSEKKVPSEAPRQVQKVASVENGADTAREKEEPQEAPKPEKMAASTGDDNDSGKTIKPKAGSSEQTPGRRPPTTDITPPMNDDTPKPQTVEAPPKLPKQDVSVASAGQSGDSAEKKMGRPGDPIIDRRQPTMVIEKPPVETDNGPIDEPEPPDKPLPPKEPSPIPLERVISKGRRIYMYTLLLVASFLGVFIINQTVSFVSRLSTLPLLVSIPLGMAMVAFLGIIIFFMCKVLRSFFRLKQSPQVSLMPISPVEGRRRMQELCGQRNKEARNLLYKTLKEIDSKAYADALTELNISSDSIRNLARVRRELCDSHEHNRKSSREWLSDFKQYQGMVDGIAEERIASHSNKCAIAATASRIPTMDRFIVLSSMFAMCKDLLVIYNLKPSRFNIAILMAKIIINTFCAGYVQGVTEEAGNLAGKGVEGLVKAVPWVGDAISKISALSAEFVAYELLMHHLGKATQKMLQPLAEG